MNQVEDYLDQMDRFMAHSSLLVRLEKSAKIPRLKVLELSQPFNIRFMWVSPSGCALLSAFSLKSMRTLW
jgi:hypothetical protein